ncbi:MAG TPA: AI-2E family transporter [Methanoregula sp.]|nr:AI-2E family transporter [Methanoregula sp.]
MDRIRVSENKQVVLLIAAIYIVCILVFWPLMTVLIWSAAIAVALMSFHKRLSGIVKPSVSVTFITLWVLLVILLVLSVSSNILYGNIDYIGTMVSSLVSGLKNTGFSAFLPTLTEKQVSNMPETLIQLLLQSILSLSGNVMQSIISIIIFFLSLSMLLYYGEEIWNTLTCTLSPKLRQAVDRMAEISANTIYALIIVQISAALIAFLLAIPFFFLLGVDDPFLFATLIGLGMLIPLIGAQIVILFFTFYFLSLGETWSAIITLVVGYPLLSGWIDFYYRPVMMGKRVAIPPVMMMIGIFAGVPFMGIVGFIIGPVLVALAVTGYKILAEEAKSHDEESSQG